MQGFFLPFKCNASASDPKVLPGEGGCHVPRQGTALYHDQEQTIHGPSCPANGTGNQACCGVPCGEYVFDHRNGSMLTQWMIEEFVGGEDGIDSPYIDGFCESHVLCLLASACAHQTCLRTCCRG